MSAHYRSAHPVILLVVATAVATLNAATARISTASAGAQAVEPQAARAAHMQAHYAQVLTAHAAVIRGDLAATRAPAAWLAEHDAPPSLPPGSAPFVEQMRRAARRTVQAPTVLEAALGTADMLKTCGDCHRVGGTMPSVSPSSGPDVGGVVGHMLEHQRAADQMLQALVIPSGAMWRSGTGGFSTAPLRASKLPDDPKLTREIIVSERRIHELAAQAAKTDDGGARAVFYGQIIARCADCHALHRKVWGPSGR